MEVGRFAGTEAFQGEVALEPRNPSPSPAPPRASRPAVRDHRLRGVFDISMAVSILAVLIGLAGYIYHPAPVRAAVAGAGTIVRELRNSVTMQHLRTGRWAVTPELEERADSSDFLARIERDGPTFVVVMSDKYPEVAGKRLAFRLARHPARPNGPRVWLCGFAEPPAGYTVLGPNPTDIDRKYLPTNCKGDGG